MKCAYCKQPVDNTIICEPCDYKRSKDLLREQIQRCQRMATYTNDPSLLKEIAKSQMEALMELQSVTF